MSKFLDLWPGASPCVRCGLECKKTPCSFGEWNEEKSQCKFLEGNKPGEYFCGIAEEIIKKPGWELSPAFGAGCSSSLFNTDRQKVLAERRKNQGPSGSSKISS